MKQENLAQSTPLESTKKNNLLIYPLAGFLIFGVKFFMYIVNVISLKYFFDWKNYFR